MEVVNLTNENNMNHQEFKNKWIWKWYSETKEYGTQCVAGSKIYAKEVYGVSLASFSGSAYNGWLTGSPFVNRPFKRIYNSRTFIPEVWDIAFFWPTKNNRYWHTGIVDTGSDMYTCYLLNQNAGNWDWKWQDDTFRVTKFNYINPKFLWVFRYIK